MVAAWGTKQTPRAPCFCSLCCLSPLCTHHTTCAFTHQIPLELLEGCVDLAAAGGYGQKPPSKERLAEGLGAMAGRWPLPRWAWLVQRELMVVLLLLTVLLLVSPRNTALLNHVHHPAHLPPGWLVRATAPHC